MEFILFQGQVQALQTSHSLHPRGTTIRLETGPDMGEKETGDSLGIAGYPVQPSTAGDKSIARLHGCRPQWKAGWSWEGGG